MTHKRTLYKLSFPNGKVYIGCTDNVKQRWAGNGAHYVQIPAVYTAIQEFGWDNIAKEIIATLPACFESDRAIRALEKQNLLVIGVGSTKLLPLKCKIG